MSDLFKPDEINWAGHRMLFSVGEVSELVQKNLTMWPYVLFDELQEVQIQPNPNATPKNIEYNLILKTKPEDFDQKCNVLLQMIDKVLGYKEYHLIVKINNKQQFSTVKNVRPREQPAKRVGTAKRSRKKTKQKRAGRF